MAAVVTIVMERETRKGEEKDLRVMEVLHDKDNVIRELNKEVCPLLLIKSAVFLRKYN